MNDKPDMNKMESGDSLNETGYDIDLELIRRQKRAGHGRALKSAAQTAQKPASQPAPQPAPSEYKNAAPEGEDDSRTIACNVVSDAVPGQGDLKTRQTDTVKAADACDDDILSESDEGKKRSSGGKRIRRRGDNAIVGLIKGVIYIVSVIVIGVALAVFAVIPIGNDIFALQKEERVIDVTVPELATLNDIAELLFDNGIISYPKIFKIYAGFTKDDGVYIAGDYSLSTTQNYRQLLESFKPDDDIEIVSITIPEGFTTDEIIELFVSKGIGTHEGFIDAINTYDWSEEYHFWFIDELLENGISEDRYYRLDGYLYPDTYYFYTNSSEVAAIAKLLSNFESKFSETYRSYVSSHGFTVDEIITLASMIECEAKYLSEFSLVSSVFHNRMKNSSSYPYLESDATIMYAIFHETGERPERLTSTDYETPYNTYDYRGLPPGPISNPGFNAITYAIYPRSTDYFYFVANNDGYSVFSETLSAHQAAIRAVIDGTAISTIMQGSSSAEYQE